MMVGNMSAPAELASLTSSVEELIGRLVRLTESLADSEREQLAGDLVEVERSLRAAHRRLGRASDRASA
jgi:enoyl-[acyl-carrier-protein] reductase (NADH)